MCTFIYVLQQRENPSSYGKGEGEIREQSKSFWLSDKLYIAINDSLHCQFIPLWISWCGHKSMWPVVLRPLWLFIYSSKVSGVKMPAYMTAGVAATVACVHLCTTHLKLTLLSGLGWPPMPAKSCGSKPATSQWRDIFHPALVCTTLCIPDVPLVPSPQCPHTTRSWAVHLKYGYDF